MLYTYFFLDTVIWCIEKLIIAVKTKDSQADVCKVSTAVKRNTVLYSTHAIINPLNNFWNFCFCRTSFYNTLGFFFIKRTK